MLSASTVFYADNANVTFTSKALKFVFLEIFFTAFGRPNYLIFFICLLGNYDHIFVHKFCPK